MCPYDEAMKAYLFSVALVGGIVVTNACLAEERAHTPAHHAPEGPAVANPNHAGGHEAPGPGGSPGSVQAAPGAAGEHSGAEGHDKGVSSVLVEYFRTAPCLAGIGTACQRRSLGLMIWFMRARRVSGCSVALWPQQIDRMVLGIVTSDKFCYRKSEGF